MNVYTHTHIRIQTRLWVALRVGCRERYVRLSMMLLCLGGNLELR